MTKKREPAQQLLPMLDEMIAVLAEAVLFIDTSGRVIAINQSAADLFDIGERANGLRPIDEYDRFVTSLKVDGEPFDLGRLRQSLDGVSLSVRRSTLTTARGHDRIIDFTALPVADSGGRVILGKVVASDVTREERQRNLWSAISTAARGIETELNSEKVIGSVLDQTVEALAAEVVIGVWRVTEDRQKLELVSRRGLSEATAKRLRTLPIDGKSSISESARTKTSKFSEDIRIRPAAHEEDKVLLEQEGIVSWLAAPLLSGGQLVGAMAYGSRGQRRFYPEDREAIEVIGGLFGAAIRHAELYEKSQAGLRAEELFGARQSAIVESLSEGLIVVEPPGQMELLNSAARRLLGLPDSKRSLSPEEYSRLDLRRPDGTPLPFAERGIVQILRGETVENLASVLTAPDGTERHLLLSGRPVLDGEGRVVLAIDVLHDVTALRELERIREDYLRAVTHDVRNPLSSVLGAAQVIQRFADQPEMVRRNAELLELSARRMNQMLGELADSLRIESGRVELHPRPVDLPSLVSSLRDQMEGVNGGRRQRIRVEVAEALPPVHADPESLERIVTNLLSNALKYSDEGSEIVVEIARRSDDLEVAVRDQGRGISPEHLARLFDRYYRVERGTERREGLGLGLYITKGLVQANGGRISVESHPGQGSTFRFSLPIAAREERAA